MRRIIFCSLEARLRVGWNGILLKNFTFRPMGLHTREIVFKKVQFMNRLICLINSTKMSLFQFVSDNFITVKLAIFHIHNESRTLFSL
jgi:hypothetical protein